MVVPILFQKTRELVTWWPTSAQGDIVISQLDRKFQSGLLFDRVDVYMYLFIWAASFLFFWQNFNFWSALFRLFDHKAYLDRNEAQRLRYVKAWMNNTFHVIIPIMSFLVTYYSCSNDQGWPWPSQQGSSFTSLASPERWGWVRDDVCMLEFNKGAVIVIMIANGFLCFDLIVIRFWLKDRNALTSQMEAHHVVAIVGFTLSIFSGYGMPVVSSSSMLSEISGFWLILKDMFSKENRNSPIGKFVQIMFLLTYTFFRWIPMLFLNMRVIVITMLTFHRVSHFRQFCHIVCSVNACFIMAINTYWYGLILRGLKRLLEEQGVLTKPKGVDYSDIDKYELNAQSIPSTKTKKLT